MTATPLVGCPPGLKADGTRNIPGADSPWSDWVTPYDLRHWCDDDPLLDWLDLYGEARGFSRDDRGPACDPRTDFQAFIVDKARQFEALVLRHLARSRAIVRIAQRPDQSRSLECATATGEAMTAGAELISQAVLWDAEAQRYGVADLLVRSDTLRTLFPSALSEVDARVPAPLLPGARWHYRVVEIKYSTLHLLKSGQAAANHLFAALQAWIYNEALGRLQGVTPEASHLLGRRWEQNGVRGASALEALARVERTGRITRQGPTLAEIARDGSLWLRRLRRHGDTWAVVPLPTVQQLRPNMRNSEDHPWHSAKTAIADSLHDLTLLPRVTPEHRTAAHAIGISRWTDPKCTAASLGFDTPKLGPLLDAVIGTNQSPDALVQPVRVRAAEHRWRTPAPAEFYVDFETVSDLDDDFATFPVAGRKAMIFMIGCGQVLPDGRWDFRVFTVRRLNEPEEARIIEEWLEHMRNACAARAAGLAEARILHWSPAETSTLSNAYNSAAARHGLPGWDQLPWVDLLGEVMKAEPVTVKGAFGFGLKAIARAMHSNGLIQTVWADGPTDGLGAMTGAWWCDHEADRNGVAMTSLDLMREIERYNEVDCRVMAEILGWLRQNR